MHSFHRFHVQHDDSPLRQGRTFRVAAAALVAAAAGTLLSAPAARAQGGAVTVSLPVSATVVMPLALTVTRPLAFGKLVAGTSKSVDPASASGARAEITGSGGASVTLALTMPATLTVSGGSATLTSGGWLYQTSTSATLSGATNTGFLAGTEVAVPLTLTGTGASKMYVAIGAMVQSAPDQAPGDYSGTGRISVFYADI